MEMKRSATDSRREPQAGTPGSPGGARGGGWGGGVGGALTPLCSRPAGRWFLRGGEGRRFHHYPVVVKLAGDNGGRQGARGIHGAAGVVDLQRKAGVRERREMTRTVQGSLRPSAALDLSLRGVPVMGS